MELADLMGRLANDIESILKPNLGKLMNPLLVNDIFNQVIYQFKEYENEKFIYNLDVRVDTDKDLIISFEAERIEIALVYLHLIKSEEFKFNVEVYPKKT